MGPKAAKGQQVKAKAKPGKFGGSNYQPNHLGPEPAEPRSIEELLLVVAQEHEPEAVAAMAAAVTPQAPAVPQAQAVSPIVRQVAPSKGPKVAYSSRITFQADAQLKELARAGESQTDLLAEALNLLFRARGLPEVA